MKTSPLALALTLALALGSAAPAFAQMKMDGHPMPPAPGAAGNAAGEAYMQSMKVMDDAMKNAAMTGDPSKDFVIMMKPHHQAAVEMAQAYLKYGKDPMLTKMANDIIKSQNEEIGQMDQWMKAHSGK